MYYKCHKINFKCLGSHIDSPDWIKKAKRDNKSKNVDDRWFQYATTIALSFDKMKKTCK